jgi:hypothetical protein
MRRATPPSTLSCRRSGRRSKPTRPSAAFGLTYGRPAPGIEAVAGAPAIKTATLTVTVDDETEAPLS